VFALGMIVDGDHRVRSDRVDERAHAIWRGRDWLIGKFVEGLRALVENVSAKIGIRKRGDDEGQDETGRLLG
jgi:hypothetical protein